MNNNLISFLDMIAWSEIGTELLAVSDNGYDVIVGARPAMPILFTNYADHPRIAVQIRPGLVSTAAGRYQVLKRIFDHYKKALNLHDFSPASQDAIAVQLIKECRAMADIEAGRIELAIIRCRSRWASFPMAGHGQHEHKMAALIAAYRNAGGELAQP